MSQGMRSTPRVLNNLDGFRAWPARHRHWSFDLLEDEDHGLWVSTTSLRRFWKGLPADRALQERHGGQMLHDRNGRTHYLASKAMRMELQRCRDEPQRTDILKFLDWFARSVGQPQDRKRAWRALDEDEDEDDGKVPTAAPKTWLADHWPGLRGLAHGRGHIVLTTIGLFFAVALLLRMVSGMLMPAGLDWTISYIRIAWGYATMALLGVLGTVLMLYASTRSLLRHFSEGRQRLLAMACYLFFMPFMLIPGSACVDAEMVGFWWSGLWGRAHPVQVYADEHLGRLVLKGAMEYGSSDALAAALKANPRYTLLELQSPGGYVVEGLRMERLVREHHLDTVVLDSCASACTLVFAGGTDRYLGPESRMLFHRSGRHWQTIDYGWSDTDYRMQQLWLDRGVDRGFTEQALQEPMWRIWESPHPAMLDAHYATARWMDRKSGY